MFSSVFARVSDKRGTSFPTRKKCQELSVIFIVFMTSNSLLFFMFAVSCKRGRKFLWYPKKNERASNSVHLLTAANILKKIFLESLFLRSSTFKNPFLCVCVCDANTLLSENSFEELKNAIKRVVLCYKSLRSGFNCDFMNSLLCVWDLGLNE